jgi:hypothetical protein
MAATKGRAAHGCFLKLNLMVSRRIAILRWVHSRRSSLGELSMSNTSIDEAMTNGHEQPINWGRIVVLAAVALPAFGGLYYALLTYLLFG